MRLPDGQMVLLLPPHYVQLAAALGLNSQPMLDQVPTPTDFETLIELNRRQQQAHLEQHGIPESMDSAYWEHCKKSMATLAAMSEKFDNPAAMIAEMQKLIPKPASIVSQHDEPTNYSTNHNQSHPEPAQKMEVDEPDNIEEKGLISLTNHFPKKHEKMDDDSHEMKSRSPYHEQNQNNQNILNENLESRGSNCSEDSMWRPW